MKLIGHRGAKGLAPENTIAAMQQGLAHSVDELEIDVRVTKDNIAVLQHDQHVIAADGSIYPVKEHTFQELLAEKPTLVTLEEALTVVGHAVPIQIEIKPQVLVQPIADVIEKVLQKGWKPTDLLFGSFDQDILIALHELFPEVPIVIIDRWSSVQAVRRARQIKAKRLSMNQRWMWWPVVRNLRLMGYQVAVYTVNKPEQIKRWQKYGLYAVITDYPDRFETKKLS